MTIQGLNQAQALAFFEETTSARNLIAYALKVLRTRELGDEVRDPIFTMLSVGVEKMYKLTLGVSALNSTGAWPSAKATKAWGHQISSMHDAIVSDLLNRCAGNGPYVHGLVKEVTSDQLVRPVIDALDSYGRRGRFYHLDELGASTQSGASPRQAWRAIEGAAMKDGVVSELTRKAMENRDDSDLWARHHSAIHQRVALAVDHMQLMIAGSGRSGLLGDAGRALGLEVHQPV
ncbi:hypothetical protein [Rhodococcoides fascians]|uniref:Uncharacterized protein n=1 Tax=Rhodococcoides fascians TaxID=1828 RepID=A0A143QT46_RHOFA|nr:hypothetical protein [Rhodococcus fascians]AMY26180.1 hypothetical protein A3Q41_04925 [Rhodococcus fascians]OZC38112.1 hypothetical protein CHX23_23550 [Rhodococcus fascians]